MPRRPPEERLPLSDPGPLTVLVIGREQEDRVPFLEVLLPTGFRVKEATSGPAALETIRKEAVDIVLLGVNESAPDAMESCRFLRENRDAMKGFTVLAVTGPREEAVLAALRAGAADFFGGPLEGKFLAEKVKVHVRLRKDYERRLEVEPDRHDRGLFSVFEPIVAIHARAANRSHEVMSGLP
jgi:DNA-binding response OmpR family regulator